MISTTQHQSEIAGFHAIDVGAGRPVLLLHGVGLRAEAWKAQIDCLCGTYRVIAPDMPGHGLTPQAMQLETVEDYARAYLSVLKMLPEPALVVGHSMGAMIALELARSARGKVRGVAAFNGIFERSSTAASAVQARANELSGRDVPDPRPTLTRWFGTEHSAEREACETWLMAADPAGYKQAYTAFAQANGPSRQALAALTCPALFATGALEPNSTPQMSQAMAKLAPQGRALIVDEAAHMMPMTHATQVNTSLLEFAREVWR